jgi:uncharacterized protein YqhQ
LVLIGQENIELVEGVADTFYSSEITFVIVFLILFKLLPISNFHGAEHMVINAYLNKQEDPISVKELYETSRASNSCGSALVLIFILVRALFFWVPMESLWVSMISYAIAYEIFMRKSDYFDFVFFLSGFIQNVFLTSKPNKEQLKTAIIAIERATDEKLVEDSHQL